MRLSCCGVYILPILILVLGKWGKCDDWPQLQGPQQAGISNEKGLAREWPPTGPRLLWSRPVGLGYGGPSVGDEEVYLLDRVDDEKDVLRCLDIVSGEQLWEYANDVPGRLSHNGSRGVPTVGTEYVAAVGPFGDVYCLHRKNRNQVWHRHLFKDFAKDPPQFGYAQSALLYKKSVIVCPASEKVGLVAIEQSTGKVLWQSEPFGTKGYVSPRLTRFAGVDGILCVTEQATCCIDPKSGSMLWRFAGYNPVQPVPFPTVIGDGRFFVTAADDAGSVMIRVARRDDRFSVSEVFRLDEFGAQIHPPICYQKHIYGKFFTYNDAKKLVSRMVCFDLDGNIMWQTGEKGKLERGHLIVADGMIFSLDAQSGMLTLAAATPNGYRELATAKVLEVKSNGAIAPMALSNGKLVIRDQHEIRCLDVSVQ